MSKGVKKWKKWIKLKFLKRIRNNPIESIINIFKMEKTFRIFDFNIYNQLAKESGESDSPLNSSSEDDLTEEKRIYKDKTQFFIQIFGINEEGKTCSIIATDFKPFFYVKVAENWDIGLKNAFIDYLKQKMGKFYDESIHSCIIVKRKQLYGFDAGKKYKFLKIEFHNTTAFNKAKNLWYTPYSNDGSSRKLLPNGIRFGNTDVLLYEAHIPPLLRAFHIKEISPSGWIMLPKKKAVEIKNKDKKTICDYEFVISYKDILPLNEKETPVPFKKCSFDIEASSSHGDFPIPIKTYKKLATNIVDIFQSLEDEMDEKASMLILEKIVSFAFGFQNGEKDHLMEKVDLVYPIQPPLKEEWDDLLEKWFKSSINKTQPLLSENSVTSIENYFEKVIKLSHLQNEEEADDFAVDDEDNNSDNEMTQTSVSFQNKNKKTFQRRLPNQYKNKQTSSLLDILQDNDLKREEKITIINHTLNECFPKLEGDKVTFIGSTFMRYGEQEPYLNHCIVLNSCSNLPIENSIVETYETEKEVLLAWCDLMRRENPDIIIGYNIFGFDYEFMFRRAEENYCVEDFLKLSRNKDEICGNKEKDKDLMGNNKYKIEETSIQIASGQHDLHYIKMNGRLQVDLYNFYRREENLTSYKLDYVSGYFIGDYVKKIEIEKEENKTTVSSGNLTGLLEGSFVHFEEIGHSVDYYESGAKFKVTFVDKKNAVFQINGQISPDFNKKVRWCLAKDDVTPKDIFEMTRGSADDRAVIAKYCIQDCNLVHYLMNKSDVLTGFIEMAKICSVPMSFLVLRGQGIKLTSFIAKKCREKETLVPTIDKGSMDDGYEGAIVLDPKCDLYLDNPVACVDYASLYPSSIISENLSHDSKVWTKEYDLAGNLICETGEKMIGFDADGNPVECYLYDNLDGYEYVTVEYDTYTYVRKKPGAAAEKIKCGKKICRFAQFPEGKAIMPSILEELLMARKTTRKLIPQQTDEFMKNVLDKRQLAYKVTANSLYGQCGAKTSSFYEMDVAASTTAIGRMLLTYAKKVIENCYGDAVCETKDYGPVLTKAEYIYGDTDSVFFTFNLQTPGGEPIRGKKALEITIELAQEAGHLASSFLKKPHDLEYEKTFMPFCLLSKKRYVGMLYETDPNKGKRKEMGIVLKRRDNAPIVKEVYGGIIDILMKKQNIPEAIDFLNGCLKRLSDGQYPVDKLIITKSLRSDYKNPLSIAHKVLADRMTARDPGNKPGPGDRIPYVYINHPTTSVTKGKKILQGDKIETPSFILENRLKIDYSFYISNQIMKPIQQLFALVLEKIWLLQNKAGKASKFKREVEDIYKKYSEDNGYTDEDAYKRVEKLRNKEIKTLLFDPYLRETNNVKQGNQSLTKFFSKKE